MSFDQPLWALLLLPWWALVLRKETRGVVFPCARIASRIGGSLNRHLTRALPSIEAVAVSIAIVALTGPHSTLEPIVETIPGVAIQLVVDTSSSMETREGSASDSRLDTCLRSLSSFASRRVHDRMGVITFALYPRVLIPLTLDHEAVIDRLRDVRTVRSGSAEDNTAIGVALAAAGLQLASLPDRSKLIVLVTDGEQRVDDVPLRDAAEFLKTRDVRLYAIAAGRTNRGFVNELREVAEITGGRGYLARDEAALERICGEIDSFEKSQVEIQRTARSRPWHRECLLAALLLFGVLVGIAFVVFVIGGGRIRHVSPSVARVLVLASTFLEIPPAPVATPATQASSLPDADRVEGVIR